MKRIEFTFFNPELLLVLLLKAKLLDTCLKTLLIRQYIFKKITDTLIKGLFFSFSFFKFQPSSYCSGPLTWFLWQVITFIMAMTDYKNTQLVKSLVMGDKKGYIMLVNPTAASRLKPSTTRNTCNKHSSHDLESPHYRVLEKLYIKFHIISNPHDFFDNPHSRLLPPCQMRIIPPIGTPLSNRQTRRFSLPIFMGLGFPYLTM